MAADKENSFYYFGDNSVGYSHSFNSLEPKKKSIHCGALGEKDINEVLGKFLSRSYRNSSGIVKLKDVYATILEDTYLIPELAKDGYEKACKDINTFLEFHDKLEAVYFIGKNSNRKYEGFYIKVEKKKKKYLFGLIKKTYVEINLDIYGDIRLT